MEEYNMTPHVAVEQAKFLNDYFASTSFLKNGINTWLNNTLGHIVPTQLPKTQHNKEQVNFFFLPQCESNVGTLAYFRQLVFSLPKTKTPKIQSEKDWLQNTSKNWDLIQKSHFIAEYNRYLQKSALYKTWEFLQMLLVVQNSNVELWLLQNWC